MHSCAITVNLCIRYITVNKPLSLGEKYLVDKCLDIYPGDNTMVKDSRLTDVLVTYTILKDIQMTNTRVTDT